MSGCGCMKEMVFLEYDTSTLQYANQISIPPNQYLNAFAVKNDGTTIVRFNGELIFPGFTKSVGGNYGEIYTGRLDLAFQVPSPAPGTIINSAWVTQKFYKIKRV